MDLLVSKAGCIQGHDPVIAFSLWQIILENSELIEGSMVGLFQHFISHIESFRVLLKEWEDGNFSHAEPAVKWDADR